MLVNTYIFLVAVSLLSSMGSSQDSFLPLYCLGEFLTRYDLEEVRELSVNGL